MSLHDPNLCRHINRLQIVPQTVLPDRSSEGRTGASRQPWDRPLCSRVFHECYFLDPVTVTSHERFLRTLPGIWPRGANATVRWKEARFSHPMVL